MDLIVALKCWAFLLLLSAGGTEGRARLGRNQVQARGEETDGTAQLVNDLESLNEAVKTEIRLEEAEGVDLSENRLEQDVAAHNEDQPWWKRLTHYLRREFSGLVKGLLRKGLEEHVYPALSKQLLR